MRVLVTGADGFVGKHLCKHLRESGDDVIEAGSPHAAPVEGRVYALDVTAQGWVEEVLSAVRPEGIIHLAGQSSVGKSHQDPSRSFAVNAQGTANVLAAAHSLVPSCRLLLIGSGEMYGPVANGASADESTPLLPTSPYAASKVAAEVMGLQFHRSYGTHVVCARPFNHIGPGQDPGFVVPSFAAQVSAIARKKAPPVLKVGNLSPERDFLHVLDVVAAYRLLLVRGEAGGVYNVSSGTGLRIEQLLELILDIAGVKASVEVDPSKVRSVELPRLVGNSSKLKTLGWAPTHSVREALSEVLDEVSSR